MAKLSIAVSDGRETINHFICGENQIVMVYEGAYQPGDKIVFSTNEPFAFYVIRVDGAMDEAYVYFTQNRVEYAIPFELNNPLGMDRISYCPGCFIGELHYITMRKVIGLENGNYRNLAKNVMDQHNNQGCYPHVVANVETTGPVAPLFSARNVIDGIVANTCHYPWPFQSWGIDQREDAEITVEFGRPVDMSELRLYTRADFPHDSWWEQAVATFSDGSWEVLHMKKSAKPHIFSIQRKGIIWLKLSDLIRGDNASPFPALTQIEVYGRNSWECISV